MAVVAALERAEATAYLDGLSKSDRKAVSTKTEKVLSLIRRTATDVREIGRQLIQLKEIVGHSRWTEYLFRELGWEDPRTAQNFMAVAVRFANVKNEKFSFLAPSVLYLLAAQSTPQAAVEEVMEQAEEDEPPTVEEAKEIVAKHKAVSLEEATASLPPQKRAEVRRIALQEARRDKLEAIERHLGAARKLMDGEPEIADAVLDQLDDVLAACRAALA